MTALYIIVSALAGACLYYSTPHQRLSPRLAPSAPWLRGTGALLFIIGITFATGAIGFLPGFFASLTTLMLTCVLFPYWDAWRTERKSVRAEISDVE